MNEIVEKKILAVETPVNRVLFSLKPPTPVFSLSRLYCTKWAKHKMEGIFFLKLENVV